MLEWGARLADRSGFMSHAQSAAIELASLLDDSLAPVYVLDEDRRIIYCNRACARWLGVAADAVLGLRCVYHSEADDGSPAGLAAELCPPPKVFSGRPLEALVCCTRPDGGTGSRRGHFVPLSDGQDESAAVVAVLESTEFAPDAAAPQPPADTLLHEQLRDLRRRMAERFRPHTLLGDSPAIARARAQIELAAASDVNVLVVGPPGSGRQHAAKAIHYAQPEPGVMVPLACDVLEVNLLRSALRAAWSPAVAVADRPRTLLLSHVDAMVPEAQSDLLELLQRDPRRVRVISTAETPLAERVSQGQFAPALACALATITIELPPLSERLDDLPLLAQAALEQENRHSAKQVGGFAREALDRLAAYAWPGNVEELIAVVRQAHERASGGEVAARDLPKEIQWAADAGAHPPLADDPIVLEEFLARVERELITRAMRRAKNNKTKAAKLLGLTRPRLYRRLVQLGLEPPDTDQKAAPS
jgi:transcriptional regulator with PAS, ATPase and Fis domain